MDSHSQPHSQRQRQWHSTCHKIHDPQAEWEGGSPGGQGSPGRRTLSITGGPFRSRLMAPVAVLIVISAAASCKRLTKAPHPKGIPESASIDSISGLWKLNRPDGQVLHYYPGGQVALEGQRENGKRTGVWKTYTEAGTIASMGDYRNDWRDGVWKFYDARGRLYLTVEYRPEPRRGFGFLVTHDYGNENGPYKRYYPSGELEEEGHYHGGYLEGPVIRYNQNGSLALEGRFTKDKKDGQWKYYYPSGELEKVVPYKRDEVHGQMVVYHPDGRLYQISRYIEGSVESVRIVHPL